MKWLNKLRALFLAVGLTLATAASAAGTVYDPWNHVENINQLAQQVKQVANLVEMVKSGQIIQEIAQANGLGWVIDLVETYQQTAGALENLQSSLNNLYQAANSSSASMEEIARMYLNSPVQTWDEFVEREERIAEANNGVHTAAFQHATETIRSLEQQQRTIKTLGEKANTSRGTNQLLVTLNQNANLIASQNAQILAITAQKVAAEADEKQQREAKAKEISEKTRDAVNRTVATNLQRFVDAVSPDGQIATTLIGIPAMLSKASTQIAKLLTPSATNLLLLFSTLALVWIGIEMMMGGNVNDNILFGEVIALLLKFGLCMGILQNHQYLSETLISSVDYLSSTMGVGNTLHDMVADSMRRFFLEPGRQLKDLDDAVFALGDKDPPGFWQSISNLISSPLVIIGNVIQYIGIFAMTVVFIALAMMATLLGIFIVIIADSLFGVIVTLGVICVPFFVLPKLEKIFWSWFDGLVYALALKMTVSGILALTAAMHTTSVAYFSVDSDGFIDIQWTGVLLLPMMAAVMLILLRYSFTIAGIIAGTRLSIDPVGGMMSLKVADDIASTATATQQAAKAGSGGGGITISGGAAGGGHTPIGGAGRPPSLPSP